jgi:hypothetical protein
MAVKKSLKYDIKNTLGLNTCLKKIILEGKKNY